MARQIAVTTALVLFAVTTATTQQAPAGGVPTAPAGRQGGRGALQPDPAAVARGLQIYTTNCSTCHGANGRGGDGGTDLTASAIVFANDDGQPLGGFLKVGRPERRMPPFQLSDGEIADLSAFIRALAPAGRGGGAGGRGAIVAVVVGDGKAGETYFNGAGGCTACHSPIGDLKGIGTRLPAASIQGRLVLPRGNGGYPPGFNQPPNPSEAPRTVTVTLPSGEQVSGKLMWITDFNVTLMDASGIQRTIARHGEVPKVDVVDPLQWHLDHMRTLTDNNMHNLTAYLVTLK